MLKALLRPRRLRPGGTVAIIAPSGPVEADRLERGAALFGAQGLRVVRGAHVRDRVGHLAGTDADRAADLQAAWCDPTVRAVVCARGGYGAMRLLDLLDWTAMRARVEAGDPPVFLGASDVTSLHLAIAARLGVATLFGPMAAAEILAGEQPDEPTLRHLVTTLVTPEKVQLLGGPGVRALVPGTASGVTTGGTLSLLAAAAGTPEPLCAAGGVVLLEDVAEPPYRIDRMLTQLLRSGALDGAAAVVAGDWAGCGPAEAVDTVLLERLGPLGVPVLAGLRVGHGPVQTTFPLGVDVEVDAAAGTVTLAEPALR